MVRRGIFITEHAISRYRERVEPCPDEEIARRLTSDAIVTAANFGARTVRLAGGQRVILDAGAVITVLAPGMNDPVGRATPRHPRGRRPLPPLEHRLEP